MRDRTEHTDRRVSRYGSPDESRGVTLIDTVVGTALMLVVFLGIAAAFRLSLEAVTNNKARAGAIALANERMELLRSLPYASVGVVGGIPAGTVPQIETISMNGVSYERRTLVAYRDDPRDGTGAADSNGITTDYREIRVEVSWDLHGSPRSVVLVGRISPPGVETACSSCGTIVINVRDAASLGLADARVEITNASTTPAINIVTYTNASGTVSFLGAPAATRYAVVVSKAGYSSAQTYAAAAPNTNPSPGHLTVSSNQTTTGTFAIDQWAGKTIRTYKRIAEQTWSDSFASDALTATTTAVSISGGSARLSGTAPYPATGEVQSVSVGPSQYLARWKRLTTVHSKPAGTGISYRVYAADGSLIPDTQLPGNSAGFTATSTDLSGISTTTYPAIRVGATLTSNGASTPVLDSWSVSYDSGPEPLPSLAFTMRGTKTIGANAQNQPIYKFDTTLNSGSGSEFSTSTLEWDTYVVSVNGTSTGYDIASACHPAGEYAASLPTTSFSIAPGNASESRFMFATHTVNSLRVEVRSASGALIPGATVNLWRSGLATSTQASDECGQAFYPGLTSASYYVSVTAAGYQGVLTGGVQVGGASRVLMTLN